MDISLTAMPLRPHPMPYPARALDGELKVILFDVYGTILLSAAGEIGNTVYSYGRQNTEIERAFAHACRATCAALFSVDHPLSHYAAFHAHYLRAIRATHAELKRQGIATPEVDIREIWKGILTHQRKRLVISPALLTPKRIALFAIGVELMTNPVQLAPRIEQTLSVARLAGYRLGIVSNAQFYTPLILEYLFGRSLVECGFEEALCYWSYRHRIAKPARSCFQHAAAAARDECGAEPSEILYIGNDVVNDIAPAHNCGFRACLYCGDSRSLRLRPESRVDETQADTWITDYRALPPLLQ